MGSEQHDFGHSKACDGCIGLLKNQSVFNFCAVPATMAMATLKLCFMNKDIFQQNIKIHEAATVKVHSLFFPV